MSRLVSYCTLVLTLALAFGACAPPENLAQPAARPTVEELMEAWRILPAMGAEKMDVTTAGLVGIELAKYGPEGLMPLVEIVGNPDEDNTTKVLAVITLTPNLKIELLPRISEICGPDYTPVSRVLAIDLLGQFMVDQAESRLLGLADDPNHRVSTEAITMLVMRNHATGLERIAAAWDHPETNAKQKTNMVLQFPESAYAQLEGLLLEAAVDPDIELGARQRAVQLLGSFGGAPVLETLEKCAKSDEDESLRALAASAAEAVRARTSE